MNCCGKVHIWKLTKVLCTLELLGTIALVVTLIFVTMDDFVHSIISTKEILFFWCIISMMCSILFILGIVNRYKQFMIPKLVVEIIDCVIELILAVYALTLLSSSPNVNLGLLILSTSLLRFFAQCYFFVVLIYAYRFVHDYRVYMLYR